MSKYQRRNETNKVVLFYNWKQCTKNLWDVFSQTELSFPSHLFPFISLCFFSSLSLMKFQQRRHDLSGTNRLFFPSFLIFSCAFFTPTSNHVATYHCLISVALSISQLSRKRKHQSFRLAPTRRAFNALENCSGPVFRQETAWRHPADRWRSGSSRVTLCDWQDEVKEFSPIAEFSAIRDTPFLVFRGENVSTSYHMKSTKQTFWDDLILSV